MVVALTKTCGLQKGHKHARPYFHTDRPGRRSAKLGHGGHRCGSHVSERRRNAWEAALTQGLGARPICFAGGRRRRQARGRLFGMGAVCSVVSQPLVDRITPSRLPPSISGTAETSTWAPWTGTPCSVPVINTPFNVSRNRERLRSGSERNAFRIFRRHRCCNCLSLCLSTSRRWLVRALNSSTTSRAITPLPAAVTSDLQPAHLN